MQDILIVVDMQNDFVDGSLGTPEAQRIVDHVVEKIMHFEGRVLFTQDTHESDYLETQEGVRLPVEHCIRGTKGWELVPAIEALLMPESQVIEKPTFGSSELVGLLERLNEEEPIRFHHACRALHRYLRHLKRVADQSVLPGNSDRRGCDMLCGRGRSKVTEGRLTPCACVRSTSLSDT